MNLNSGAMLSPYVTVREVDEGGRFTRWRWRCYAPRCPDLGNATDSTYAEQSAWEMWEAHAVAKHYHDAGDDEDEPDDVLLAIPSAARLAAIFDAKVLKLAAEIRASE